MPCQLKFTAPLSLDIELRRLASTQGRTLGETILKAVQAGMASAPKMPDDTAIIDQCERGKAGQATAAYLSAPLSSAIQRLARESDRSASWIMRSLIRDASRARGILPPATTAADSAA
jgi:hypothetical protein